ncbi:MAG: polyhydroxyalkanoate synthesis regulator DNA-binding domain-containing protein [Deltaproteobacteria bacterium]|nr:polyhydroxyalkanoate synthesis regulator DNA-binding domain-containing protein [Deltaproteobacteria bacterium]
MNTIKIIKRYSNRKLYDTIESKYVTLNDISEMIRSGVDVKIVDNQTNKDITSAVLAHVLFNEEKSRSTLSINTLKELIKSGHETITEYYHKKVLPKFLKETTNNTSSTNDHEASGSVEITSFLKDSFEKLDRQFKLNINEFINTFPSVKRIREELDRINERVLRLESRLDSLIERLEKKKKDGDN